MFKERDSVRKIGIIGGGVMGSGLARYFLAKDFVVTVIEVENGLANMVLQKMEQVFSKEVERGKFDKQKAAKCLANLCVGTEMASLKEAGIVIEAVPEDLSLKKRVLSAAEKVLPPEAIIASNTSSLPISALAVALAQPKRFLGTHFFNPPHVMPLVEVIPSIDTDSVVVTDVLDLFSLAGKKPIRVKECPGFLVNRVLGAYMNEVLWLLEGEAGIQDVETAAEKLGLPMGPVTLGDMVGWDIIHAANRTLAEYYGQRFQVPPLLTKLYAEKRLGVKTGKGFMDHTVKPPRATGDLAPISRNLQENGMEAVTTRMKAAIVAESLRCLGEGVASAVDLDQAMIMGAGLPKGPIALADEMGLDSVLHQLEVLTKEFGLRFWPPPILRIYVLAGHSGSSAGRGLAGKYQQHSSTNISG
jgi:3-hydroxyacyl-CoA dehydrogenase